MGATKPLFVFVAITALIGCSTTSRPQPTRVDPSRVLSGLEADIADLSAENARHAFDITSVESEKVGSILSAMRRDIAKLQAKYGAPGEVDAPALYAEIEATLDERGADGKSMVLSLRKTGAHADSHECENLCWESCGHNSVGEWVCFLTCRRHCK